MFLVVRVDCKELLPGQGSPLPPISLSSLQLGCCRSHGVGVLQASLLPLAASPHTHCFANSLHSHSLTDSMHSAQT